MTQNVELACKDLVFHFNKKHLEDPTIPMWVIKTQGETYYVNHVNCSVPWSTKETPENSHTKGSIKIKRCLVNIDDENTATITQLTAADMLRIKRKNSIRVITKLSKALRDAVNNIKHGPIKTFSGSCTSSFYVTELYNKDDYTWFLLNWSGRPDDVRILMPNEPYYKWYDESTTDIVDMDEYEELYED